MEISSCDVLIVGGGGAGLRAAIAAVETDPKHQILLSAALMARDISVYRSHCEDRRLPFAIVYADVDDFKAFNTAFLTDGQGQILSRYHKQVLLAFGEYLPFSSILSKLPAMPFSDGFTPGEGPHTLDLANGIKIAPLICYEDLMPELSRAFVKTSKANVLVNLTNDAWYGKTVAPWQHARLAQWRAIETRRTLLRVTNTGVTSVINAKGEMTQALPIFTPAVLKAQVDILEGETLYTRFGDWFAWGMTFVSIGIVLLRLRSPGESPSS